MKLINLKTKFAFGELDLVARKYWRIIPVRLLIARNKDKVSKLAIFYKMT